MEAQRGQTTHSKSHSWGLTELGFKEKACLTQSWCTHPRVDGRKKIHTQAFLLTTASS